MQSTTVISLFLLLNSFCFVQPKEEKFKSTIMQVVSAFANQDSVKVARYINNIIGVYQLDKVGVFDHYNHLKSVSFTDGTYPQVLFNQSQNIKLLPLKYSALPTFNCDYGRWSNKGFLLIRQRQIIWYPRYAKTEIKMYQTPFPKRQFDSFTV
jgi:hypothetical protein